MALPPLATVDDLAGWMQVDPGTLPASAASTLDMVSAIIRKEARNTFQRRTTTLRRTPVDGVIRLPLRPIVSVDAVTRDGVPVDHVWDDETERLAVTGCTPVSVTFTHGYASVPGDVKAVALTAAQRVLSNPNDLRQETVGAVSVTYAAETIGASLSQADKDLLADYRRRAVVVRTV
ncbi:head-tail adaptor [Streptomyces phage Rowa]|uniref:Head-to-tail connector complex protein n=1 Tax=Streptomyces phage Rowa TaxID=2059883 RepID=A0A2H5BLU2_9CAUD|nr:head-tail adaptor [Streptomyces phage Rowa]AUG87273.1 head-to-tail connector complex protein [Streptomyces phage Rowa]